MHEEANSDVTDCDSSDFEEEEEEEEWAMMAYFYSEAKAKCYMSGGASPAHRRSSDLEGCSPMMAASLDFADEDERIEYFDPFGQMD